ncbi:GTP cyclohydrolase I FolE [Protaetiibacter mangrovi]|uniref:GTP cyclohydrolase 1 n=1 Tax=Protaetiibacter mangrovi TaxID=2970926 RepID=A0ABT1ZCQ1_9MICO|nr:GTP cyclohydrolase I FolE [Protaetiibacter mangrovi]MCS0498474.1 GTP cyclohydrolase I FolE [Protaetiibacter mangrovi]TPX02446.1 GTP cyclohydrolase I FolE [Schumannella luteola]
MPIDSERIEAAVVELLRAIGEDPDRPGLVQTPQRIAASYAELFAGLDEDPLEHLAEASEFADEEAAGELVLVRDVAFRSTCEHHLLPFTGVAHLAYAPADRIVGLGKLARVVETLSSRPQLQERLGEQIADALDQGLAPRGVLVVLDARHGCVTARGTRQADSTTVTVASRGTLAGPAAQAGVLALVGTASAEAP